MTDRSKDLFSLDGKIAVVTGGCGMLGQEFTTTLVNYGAKVAIIDQVSEPRPGAVHSLWNEQTSKGSIKVFKADITHRRELESALSEIKGMWGTPSVLINNAAIDSHPSAPVEENGPFETYPEDCLDKVIDVNLKGAVIASQVFGGAMAESGKGSIINISSIYGLLSPNQDIYDYRRKQGADWYKPVGYSVTKSAILNLTRYTATYWAKKGVRVNTLTPAGIFAGQDENFLRGYTERMPMGRMAKRDELNGAIVFLASDASSYMTGSNLVIDGGWTAW